jgi:hypothetical protein
MTNQITEEKIKIDISYAPLLDISKLQESYNQDGVITKEIVNGILKCFITFVVTKNKDKYVVPKKNKTSRFKKNVVGN